MAGILKVDTIQNANADNIITQTNSTTLTIGASGDTVTLAAGATSSGFGATYNGAVNWDTTAKTTTVTAASGVGYFINTTSGAVTVNLPAGSAGSIVALADYAGTWQTNNVTVNANGSEKIGGTAAPATLNTKGQTVTFVYVDSTRGWINTGDATFIEGAAYVAATGGTITTCGDYKIHSFTGPGTFTVTYAGTPVGSNSVEYLVVAGGGGAGTYYSGGGGAGGFRQNFPSPAVAGLPVTAQAYPITVGAGGAGVPGPSSPPGSLGNSGNPSIFSTITSTGGGGGGSRNTGGSGGSGGGGGNGSTPGGSGNTPPVSPSQGNNGGNGNGTGGVTNIAGGGGGGAGAAGTNGVFSSVKGVGGAGTATSISGSSVTYAGGGGGAFSSSPLCRTAGGVGGGGPAGNNSPSVTGDAGTANTGGGAGGGGENSNGTAAAGGSGIVIIRYKFQ
jgi:hypothetical protein